MHPDSVRSDSTHPDTGTVRGAAPAVRLRRRGEALETAIFDAALEELTAVGYARLTMEGVAARAQTGKAAIYRRWPSKQELVEDALRARLPAAGPTPDTGTLRGDLIELVARLRAAMLSGPGTAVRAVMGELDQQRAHAFLEIVHGRVVEPTTRLIAEVLARGAERGEVRPGAATPLVTDVVPALMLYRMKLGRGILGQGDTEAIVDEVLLPMVRP